MYMYMYNVDGHRHSGVLVDKTTKIICKFIQCNCVANLHFTLYMYLQFVLYKIVHVQQDIVNNIVDSTFTN